MGIARVMAHHGVVGRAGGLGIDWPVAGAGDRVRGAAEEALERTEDSLVLAGLAGAAAHDVLVALGRDRVLLVGLLLLMVGVVVVVRVMVVGLVVRGRRWAAVGGIWCVY